MTITLNERKKFEFHLGNLWKGEVGLSQLSVQEMSSFLYSRMANPYAHHHQEMEFPHRAWDITNRAALVILWGFLVYPQLDPELKWRKTTNIHIDQLVYLFSEYLGDKEQCAQRLSLFRHYDYIRLGENGEIVAGTRLLAAIDAAKMYRFFHSSVLARRIHRLLTKHAE